MANVVVVVGGTVLVVLVGALDEVVGSEELVLDICWAPVQAETTSKVETSPRRIGG
ncbi:MAG: hypothetical protein WEE53_06445 [Acidimicrobiia bacterium]